MMKTRARFIIGGKECDLLDTKKHKNLQAMACIDRLVLSIFNIVQVVEPSIVSGWMRVIDRRNCFVRQVELPRTLSHL